MIERPLPAAHREESKDDVTPDRSFTWERLGVLYARMALGAAFLSAVASRFGLWDRTLDLKHFAAFTQYTAQVLSFVPSVFIPPLAWAATAAEMTLGLLLVSGFWQRSVSLASAALLAAFGAAMAVSFGIKSPMDYSVFSASGAAVLLSMRASPNSTVYLRSSGRGGKHT